MGIVKDIVGGIFGSGSDAAEDAAGAQARAVEKGIEFQREALGQTREDLAPFREFGEEQIDPLSDLISQQETLATDPKAQLDFVQDNPFFNALADESKQRIFQNQAARGKVGSGGTAEALQNSLLLLGNDLLDRQLNRGQMAVGNRGDILQLGANAAARQGQANIQTGRTLADLATQGGNAEASGIMGARNAQTGAVNQAIDTGLGIFALSDIRKKDNVEQIGTSPSGIPIYKFQYKDSDQTQLGVMAQDLIEVAPEAVAEKDGTLYVNYELIPW